MNVTDGRTDRQTDRQTDRHCVTAYTALASHRAVKTANINVKNCSLDKKVILLNSTLTLRRCADG